MGIYSPEAPSAAAECVEHVNSEPEKYGFGQLSPEATEQLYSETLDAWPAEGRPSATDPPFPLPGDEQYRDYQALPEGWDELSEKDQRLVQQFINRLRYVDSED